MAQIIDDRCDRCSAKAMKQINFPSGHTLQFCSHHTARYMPQIQVTVLVTDLEPAEAPVPVA